MTVSPIAAVPKSLAPATIVDARSKVAEPGPSNSSMRVAMAARALSDMLVVADEERPNSDDLARLRAALFSRRPSASANASPALNRVLKAGAKLYDAIETGRRELVRLAASELRTAIAAMLKQADEPKSTAKLATQILEGLAGAGGSAREKSLNQASIQPR